MTSGEYRQKFEFYAVGLTFTLLAASIHTASFDSPVASFFELVAWIMLLGAGLTGFWYFELMPELIGASNQKVEKAGGPRWAGFPPHAVCLLHAGDAQEEP